VVTVDNLEDVPFVGAPRWAETNIRPAACGIQVHPARYTLKESNEVCLKCRKALRWPMVVTWTQNGHTFTTDFNRPK